MADIRVEITGIDNLSVRLSRIDNMMWAGKPIEHSLRLLQSELSRYPPAVATSQYVRTGWLGRGWTVQALEYNKLRVRMRLGNNREYAPWVQSRNFQARIHRRRWLTEADAVEQNRRQIAAIFEAAIRRVAG